MRSFLVTKVNPNYPPEAQRQHVDGMVLLHIDIDENGNVSKVEPVSGHPLVIPAAIDAIKQWKYKPYLLNQKPVEVETTVLIKFVISGGNAYTIIAFASPKAISWRCFNNYADGHNSAAIPCCPSSLSSSARFASMRGLSPLDDSIPTS
jgi:TonB family protein